MCADFDVAIVGGGPAGATMASVLGQASAKVVLFESAPAPAWKIGETLGPEGRARLSELGVLEEFKRGSHLACHGNWSSWGSAKIGETDFVFNPHGHGWQLDRREFETTLLQRAAANGAEIRLGTGIERFHREHGNWVIETTEGTLRSRQLVDSSGRRAFVARALGINRLVTDRLVSIHALASSPSSSDRDTRTLIESAPDGWWYSALTPNGTRTVAFLTDGDLIGQQWRQMDWIRARVGATRHVSALLTAHGYVFDGAPRLTSAHSGRLEQWSGDDWLAVGDAAMSMDPLSGLGILKAMQSGQQAALALLGQGGETLESYAQWSGMRWEEFRRQQQHYYSIETRWPSQTFWARRQSG